VRVVAPVALLNRGCFAGAAGSRLACSSSGGSGGDAIFEQSALDPAELFTVVVGLPPGAITVPAPLLAERVTFDRAFARTPATVTSFVALVVILLGLVAALVWRAGRDRQFVGSPVEVSLGNDTGEDTAIPLLDHKVVPVEFTPPDGVRPGQIGTLIDGRANPLDITATIVDLGARGYLTITELPSHGLFAKTDWKLTRLDHPDGALLSYEASLLDALFDQRHEVNLSQLRNTFAATLHDLQHRLYRDMSDRGWYRRRPARAWELWLAIGGSITFIGTLGTLILGYHTHAALPALAVPIAGIALLVAAPWMPQRTARGTSARRRALGFRDYIRQAETDRARFAEQQNLFTEYLAYAVVFGATDKWAKAFAGLNDEVPQPAFFFSPHPFTAAGFTSSMHAFTTSATGTVGAAAHAGGGGGGGFAGGGCGGGGGGSW